MGIQHIQNAPNVQAEQNNTPADQAVTTTPIEQLQPEPMLDHNKPKNHVASDPPTASIVVELPKIDSEQLNTIPHLKDPNSTSPKKSTKDVAESSGNNSTAIKQPPTADKPKPNATNPNTDKPPNALKPTAEVPADKQPMAKLEQPSSMEKPEKSSITFKDTNSSQP